MIELLSEEADFEVALTVDMCSMVEVPGISRLNSSSAIDVTIECFDVMEYLARSIRESKGGTSETP